MYSRVCMKEICLHMTCCMFVVVVCLFVYVLLGFFSPNCPREVFEFEDGGQAALDWAVSPLIPERSPVMLILTGVVGE